MAMTDMELIAALKACGINVMKNPNGEKTVVCSLDKLQRFLLEQAKQMELERKKA